jgi:hypothetical protein
MPNDSGFGTDVTSWAQAAVTNATTTTGASIATSTNSTYTFAQFFLPTVGSSLGNFDKASTFAVDVVSEVQSTASGAYGFDVWAYDWDSTLWRRIKTVVRTGQVNVVVDMRSSDMLAKFQDVTGASNPMKFLFRTRATNRGPGAKLTFKNVTLLGNRGFDPAYTSAASMGNYGAYYVKLKDKPKAISWVQIDNRESQYVSAPQTLTAGVDYIIAPEGVVFPIPAPNLHINSMNGAKVLVRYTRDFLVSGESLPETWYRTGDLSAHHRAVSVAFTDMRASVEDDLNL